MDQISMVFQRVYLFQDTIYNNISMGKPDATEEEVYEAAKKARCYDFIMALPDGFQTVWVKAALPFPAARNSEFRLHAAF